MQSSEHRFEITKQVRYFTWGTPSPKIKQILLVLHGYGQHPEFFIRHFHFLQGDDVLVVAPEGPHRFYVSGFSGRVGASWMTKEDRLTDIEDHIRYLDALVVSIKTQVSKTAQWHVLGFSQGVATATRWLEQGKHNINTLTCWAGSLPQDVAFTAPESPFATLPFWAFYGDADALVPAAQQAPFLLTLQPHLPHFQVMQYAGGHAFDPAVLQQHIHTLLGR